MNPFAQPKNPDDLATIGEPLSVQSAGRPGVSFFLVGLCLVVSQFMPWVLIRIPGRDLSSISLFRFIGGAGFVFVFFFVFTIGVIVWIAGSQIGIAVTAVSVAFVGWFGVLVSVALGVVRGIIPQVGVGKVDLSRGLIGVGSGAVIAIAALILVALELLPREASRSQTARNLDGFGVVGFLLGIALAMTHIAVWISGSSSKFDAILELSGDSLFGSFILSALVWITAIVGVLTALKLSKRGQMVLSILLIVAGVSKFFHALIFVIGRGIVGALLPGSVGEVSQIQVRWPLWLTLILSLVSIVVGMAGVLAPSAREKMGALASFDILPSVALVVATSITLVGTQFGVSQSDTPSDSTLDVSTSTTLASTSTLTQSSEASASADLISRSVVLVVVTRSDGEPCWSGSGVAVLDGTYVLTNHHVVMPQEGDDPSCSIVSVGITDDPAREPTRIISGMSIEASDDNLDLALLKMPVGELSLRPLTIVSQRLKIDTKIRVIGYPGVGGTTITLSEGVISGIDRRSGTDFYKVSAQISPGNSGGPAVDSAGNLIGIATAYVPADVTCDGRDSCYAQGANLGLVRPIDFATSLLANR